MKPTQGIVREGLGIVEMRSRPAFMRFREGRDSFLACAYTCAPAPLHARVHPPLCLCVLCFLCVFSVLTQEIKIYKLSLTIPNPPFPSVYAVEASLG